MSKILYACFRKKREKEFSPLNFSKLSKRLEPDNISFRPPKIIEGLKEIIGIFNPNDTLTIQGQSICHGVMINPASNWAEPLSDIPDGSFALYRTSNSVLEIITDVTASKTIWYYYDNEKFIASSSQRAIVFFLKSLQFNVDVIPWQLATGSLGPGYSWDKRLKMIKPDSTLTLDRISWELSLSEREFKIYNKGESKKYYEKELLNALKDTVGSLDLDYSKWVLPLSGGYDSRGLLYMLKSTNGLKSITWGLKESLRNQKNDAYLAMLLAQKFNVEHNYYLTETSNEPISDIFKRYLVSGEGRVDRIPAYMDGLKVWKDLYESGVEGIIRGDQSFGQLYVISEMDVRIRSGISRFSDYNNLRNIHKYGIDSQKIPEWILKREDETLENWQIRLYQQYRLPYFIAALNEIKLSFVEVITPYLTRSTIDVVRGLPVNLRIDKILFKKIVDMSGPKMPYAKYSALKPISDIFAQKEVMDEIIREIGSSNSTILPREFLNYLLEKVDLEKVKNVSKITLYKRNIKRHMPVKMKRLLRNSIMKMDMDYKTMAFRAYIISKMHSLLKEDAEALKEGGLS